MTEPALLQQQQTPPASSTLRRLFVWMIIIAAMAIIVVQNTRDTAPRSGHAHAVADAGNIDVQTEAVGRYAVGAKVLLEKGSPAAGAQSTGLFLAQLDKAARTQTAQIAAITVVAELNGAEAGLSRLHALPESLQKTAVARALELIYSGHLKALNADNRKVLDDQLGWFGQLAQSYGMSSTDPLRAGVERSARRTATAMGVAGGALLLMLLGGLAMLVVAIVRLHDGQIRRIYVPPPVDVTPFLEAFAIYVGAYALISVLGGKPGLAVRLLGLLGATALAIVWPLIRGVGVRHWRYGLGWHAGFGAVREIGLGLVGYIAGIPVIAIGFAITALLVKASNASPSHPIEYMIGHGNAVLILVVVMASIWAPLTEETLFRGALFHGLRGRHGWLVSAIVSSFIFAAIHPQGWTVVPTLMAIAIVFAGIREWRATVLSSAAAHCLHNSLLILLMTQILAG